MPKKKIALVGGIPINAPRKARILLLDIETIPNIVSTFQLYSPGGLRINYEDIIHEKLISCISWKWLGEKKVYHATSKKKSKKAPFWSDKDMLKQVAAVIREADIVVGHNIDRFDLPEIRARMKFHKMPPMGKIATIDTLKHARSQYRFNSNRLDFLAQHFGYKGKIETPKGLWSKVLMGDEKALATMVKYCDNDVIILEHVFREFLPEIEAATVRVFSSKGPTKKCSNCGSHHVTHQGWAKVSGQRMVKKYQCQTCRKWSRDPLPEAVPFVYEDDVVKLKKRSTKKPCRKNAIIKKNTKNSIQAKKPKKTGRRVMPLGRSLKKKVGSKKATAKT